MDIKILNQNYSVLHDDAMILAQQARFYKNCGNIDKFLEFSLNAYCHEEKAIEIYPKERIGDFTWYIFFRSLLYLGLDAKKFDEVLKLIKENNSYLKSPERKSEINRIKNIIKVGVETNNPQQINQNDEKPQNELFEIYQNRC